jgi:hypothetical protein
MAHPVPTITTAYLDASGQPRLRLSIAGFIDMLGFSSLSLSECELNKSQQLLDRIAAAIEDSRRFVRESMAASDIPERKQAWAVKYFSDNLVLGCSIDPDGLDSGWATAFVIRCVQRYQLRMSLNGFFIRGALTQGLLCLTDDIIFGPTLIESYHLESKTAIVPRILVTEALQKHLRIFCDRGSDTGAEELICRDIDGWWFVNYLQAAQSPQGVNWESIAQHKDSVLASLSGTTRHDVLPKFGWTCRYHNVFCHWHRNDPGYQDRYRIDRVDEQSTIDRLADIDAVSGKTV